jgi:hypothetical protein
MSGAAAARQRAAIIADQPRQQNYALSAYKTPAMAATNIKSWHIQQLTYINTGCSAQRGTDNKRLSTLATGAPCGISESLF